MQGTLDKGPASGADPTVSVVIPAYNAERYIDESIGSVLAQSYSNLEVIVVDDVSTDSTPQRTAAVSDHKVRLIRHRENRGPGAARNTGISHAAGEWVAFLDADDTWSANRIRGLVDAARAHDADFVTDRILKCVTTKSGRLQPMWLRRQSSSESTTPLGAAAFIRHLRTLRPLIRLSALRTTGLSFREDLMFAEDFDFALQLFAAGLKGLLLDSLGYRYRLTPGSLSARASTLEQERIVFTQWIERWDAGDLETVAALAECLKYTNLRLEGVALMDELRAVRLGDAVARLRRHPELLKLKLWHWLRDGILGSVIALQGGVARREPV